MNKVFFDNSYFQGISSFKLLISNDNSSISYPLTLNDAQKLVEAGFEYVTEIDGVKLFRKRK
jgi:hypothetical protein